MRKVLAGILGFVTGALVAALVVVLIGFSVGDLKYSKRWADILMLIFVGMVLAALFGGAMGVVAGLRVAEGQTRRAAIIFARATGTVVVLALLGAAGFWAMVRIPRPNPADLQKKQWARATGPLDPTLGLQLAHSLLACHASSRSLTPDALGASGCGHEQSLLIGSSLTRFDSGDKGWRWESVRTPRGDKVVVRPDPLLEQPGPIFEFDDERLLVRREAPGAPDFAIDTPIPAVEAYRECLLASGADGCAHLEKQRAPETRRMGPAESHWIRLVNPDTAHLRITLFPRGRYREGPFELHITARGRVYMFQEGGGWHVTNNRSSGIAIAKDPSPEPCELDPKVPCATEARQTASAARESLYQRIATRIRFALRVNPGDRVIVRFDPQTMAGLEHAVEKDLRSQQVELMPYGPVENFEQRLAEAVAYVWLPTSIPTPADQVAALARWTNRGGWRHEIHVHWMEGTLDLEGRQTMHPPGMDERYIAAADTNPLDMLPHMDRVISALSNEVRVTTLAGTDLRFRTLDRPVNRQLGSASSVDKAKIRIDRHIEVPGGVLRVAPVETTVNGVIVMRSFWIREGVRATDVRLEFTNGRITRATAATGQGELDNYLRTQPALTYFREFCLGMNPALAWKPGDSVIPYYGYGAGVVRMSLGDNEELGGTVRGGAVRWNFFTDATVRAGNLVLVKGGRLVVK
jgi:aminopeptidase